jgi:large subunit ribosomal protein L40
MKKQKQIDPEVAKVREKRKRRKLETEIRKLQRLGKTQKPVIELCLDSNVQENIG